MGVIWQRGEGGCEAFQRINDRGYEDLHSASTKAWPRSSNHSCRHKWLKVYRVIIHVGTNDLRSSQDPETIAKNIIDIAKNSTTNKNEILVSSIVPRRDNLNGKGRQVNNILQKLCVENNFAYVNHDNIKPRKHCNYGGVHLNTAGSKILAENFILALSRQTWLGIIRDNDALIGNVSETESNSETTKYVPEDSLESKSDSHENDENISFPFLKKIRSKHPKNLFFGQLNVNLIRNKFE